MKAGGLLAGGRRAVPFVFNPLGILVVTRKEELVPMKNFLFWDFIYFYTERILERISGGSWTLGNFSWRGETSEEAGVRSPGEKWRPETSDVTNPQH